MNICVVGTGYVGLVTGACLADRGNTVWCTDADSEKVKQLKSGRLPIYEPGLTKVVTKNVAKGRLFFTDDTSEALKRAEVCFIAVGTPSKPDGSADLTQVFSVAGQIGRKGDRELIVAVKSTVPVGTAARIQQIIQQEADTHNLAERTISVVSNPEFLREGAAVADFNQPARIIIGTDNARAITALRKLYRPFMQNKVPILIMDSASAELTKYAANAMLATRISFMNEIAKLCDQVGADIERIQEGVGTDPRIGNQFLQAGVGFGGSCFPKDLTELICTAQRNGMSMPVIQAAYETNITQKSYLVDRIKNRFGEDLSGKRFGLWGLAFKPNSDDMREAPAITIVQSLLARGAMLSVYDPQAIDRARELFRDLPAVWYAANELEAIEGADALVVITEWEQFRCPDFQDIKRRLKQPVIFDGRNIYDPEHLVSLGFQYFGIGRGRSDS